MIRILVTGANGQLGRELQSIAPMFQNVFFTFANKSRLDINDAEKIEQTLKIYWPQYVINAAAYTNVEKAEDDQIDAFKINAEGVQSLAQVCNKYRVKILHISSDYVYHPNHNNPITEETPPSPKGIYARSKYHGELNLLKSGTSSIILRTSWLYSSYGSNFVKTMLNLAKKQKELQIINDQIGAPTYARDLAKAIMHIILKTEKDKLKWENQIYNYSNEGQTSWYDFAREIFSIEQMDDIQLIPVSSSQYPSKVPRPANSRMSLEKIKSTWGLTIRPWQEALEEMLTVYKNEMNKKAWQK